MSETTALAIADQYPKDKFNLLIPVRTMQELSPIHKLVINEVQISPDFNDKDVYKEKNGELALTKKALMKLMAAANIQVIESCSVPTQKCNKCIEVAQRTRMAPKCFECPFQDDVAYQVTIAVPEPSGTYRVIKATKELRMSDEQDKMTEAQFKQFKPFRTEQCEAKALNRALRQGLMLKSSYKADELKKPFAVALVMPNMADPDLKKAMIERYADNVNTLYGGPQVSLSPAGQPQMALPNSQIEVINPDDPDPEDVDLETGEINPADLVIDADIIPPSEPEPDTPPVFTCSKCDQELKEAKTRDGRIITVSQLVDAAGEGPIMCAKCIAKMVKEQQKAGDGK